MRSEIENEALANLPLLSPMFFVQVRPRRDGKFGQLFGLESYRFKAFVKRGFN